MTLAIFALLYLLVGLVFVLALGRTGEFDYRPERGHVKPNTLKYFILFCWPIPAAHFLVFGIIWLVKWVNRKFNDAAHVRY